MKFDNYITFAQDISISVFWLLAICTVVGSFVVFTGMPLLGLLYGVVGLLAVILSFALLFTAFGIYNQLKMLNQHFNPQAFEEAESLTNATLPKHQNIQPGTKTLKDPPPPSTAQNTDGFSKEEQTFSKSGTIALIVLALVIIVPILFGMFLGSKN